MAKEAHADRSQGMVPSSLTSEQLLTAPELAQLLRISRAHLYKLVTERGLPRVKLGRSTRFRWEQVERWLERNQL